VYKLQLIGRGYGLTLGVRKKLECHNIHVTGASEQIVCDCCYAIRIFPGVEVALIKIITGNCCYKKPIPLLCVHHKYPYAVAYII
jgi:hypothetical protein